MPSFEKHDYSKTMLHYLTTILVCPPLRNVTRKRSVSWLPTFGNVAAKNFLTWFAQKRCFLICSVGNITGLSIFMQVTSYRKQCFLVRPHLTDVARKHFFLVWPETLRPFIRAKISRGLNWAAAKISLERKCLYGSFTKSHKLARNTRINGTEIYHVVVVLFFSAAH